MGSLLEILAGGGSKSVEIQAGGGFNREKFSSGVISSNFQTCNTQAPSESGKSRNLSVYIFSTLHTSSYLNKFFHNRRKHVETI